MSTAYGTPNRESPHAPHVRAVRHPRWRSASKTGYYTVSGDFKAGACGKESLRVREWAVIELVAAGLNNRKIGSLLGTTENVVKNYMRVIYDKMGFDNRVELALWYVKETEGGE